MRFLLWRRFVEAFPSNRDRGAHRQMNEILRQLGGLVLGSVPTMILFITLVVLYGLLVRRPLDRVLAERRARTVGAVEQARGAIFAAEGKTAEYENRLRAAKQEIFAARETRLKRWNEERERTLDEVRQGTGERVAAARSDIRSTMDDARREIEAMSGELSTRVLRALLPAGAQGQEAAQ